MKMKINRLRDDILSNVDYLSAEYQNTNAILSDLDRIVDLDMSHTLMFLWWDEHEDSIDKINELLQEVKR